MSAYDSHYLEFFELFNQEKFFEAHEVLEDLWRVTQTEEREFYQGMIQLAALFVHVQKKNPASAEVLYERASGHLKKYPSFYMGVDIPAVLELIRKSLDEKQFPRLHL